MGIAIQLYERSSWGLTTPTTQAIVRRDLEHLNDQTKRYISQRAERATRKTRALQWWWKLDITTQMRKHAY